MKGGTQRRSTGKLTKGQKTQIKQQKAGLFSKIKNFVDKSAREYAPKKLRLNWLQSLMTGRHIPHQGPKEMARRVKQMAAGTHGY